MKAVFVSLFVSSFSILLSFFGDYNGTTANVIAAYAVGILFWLFLIVGYVLLGVINSHRKKAVENKKGKPGIIRFFSNKKAKIFDIAMIVLFVLVLICELVPKIDDNIAVVLMAILLFTIHMHCVLNGVNFNYLSGSLKDKKESD